MARQRKSIPEQGPKEERDAPPRVARRQRGLRRVVGEGERQSRNIIGERLKLARHHHTPPWTAEQLSEAVGAGDFEVNPSAILKLEVGLRGAADYEVAAFARALGVRADWLLGLTEEKMP